MYLNRTEFSHYVRIINYMFFKLGSIALKLMLETGTLNLF